MSLPRRARVARLLVALVLLPAVLTTSAGPAVAGTLTGVEWRTNRSHPSQSGARYSWIGTTATTATLSKVGMTVPTGTRVGDRYMHLPGTTSNRASTPDSAAASVNGDIDIRVKARLSDWTHTATQAFVHKNGTSGNFGYSFRLNPSGYFSLGWSPGRHNRPHGRLHRGQHAPTARPHGCA